MTLNLNHEQADRLDALLSLGCRANKGLYTARPDQIKITAEQVLDVKQRLADGQAIINITIDTGVSEYHIRGVRRGRYNFIVNNESTE